MGIARQSAKLFHAYLPWHWRQALSAARPFLEFRKPPFEGIYERYEDAPTSDFYDTPAWVEASAASTRLARKNPDIPKSPFLLALIASMSGPVRVLDFGGATGVDFAYIASQNKNPNLTYTVVDRLTACEAGQAIWSDDPRIDFRHRLPDEADFDIVFSCVSLHTVADPLSVLRKFTTYKPNFILLARHPFANRSFVRGQVNMAKPLRQWVMSLPETVSMMKEAGYSLQLNVSSGDKYNVENYPKEFAVSDTRRVMFVRQP